MGITKETTLRSSAFGGATPFLLACQADYQGRKGREQAAYPQADFLRRARVAVLAVEAGPLIEQGLSKGKLGAALRAARIQAIKDLH